MFGFFKKTCKDIVLLCFVVYIFREEIDRINKDNDNLEFELRTETDKVSQEVKNRKKLERILGDSANALKAVLSVR